MILFDCATATELLDALRLLEGRLVGSGRRLNAGTLEVREAALRSLRFREVHAPTGTPPTADTDLVAPSLLTFAEAGHRLAVSESTVKRLVKAGNLRSVHVLGASRIHADDLTEYIDGLREQVAA